MWPLKDVSEGYEACRLDKDSLPLVFVILQSLFHTVTNPQYTQLKKRYNWKIAFPASIWLSFLCGLSYSKRSDCKCLGAGACPLVLCETAMQMEDTLMSSYNRSFKCCLELIWKSKESVMTGTATIKLNKQQLSRISPDQEKQFILHSYYEKLSHPFYTQSTTMFCR